MKLFISVLGILCFSAAFGIMEQDTVEFTRVMERGWLMITGAIIYCFIDFLDEDEYL